MKVLLTANDITIGGGLERVVCNLANAFDGIGLEVEILSFYCANQQPPYPINPNVKLSFFPNTFDIHSKQPLKRLFNKTIYRLFVAYKMKQMFKDKDAIIYNCYFFPYFKNKKTKYFKIIHLHFKNAYTFKNKYFDALVLIASKELNLWSSRFKISQ